MFYTPVKFSPFIIIIWLTAGFCYGSDSPERGRYFPKKQYSGSRIPNFNDIKGNIPVPVLADNTQWLSLYWKTWELAFKHLKKPPEGSPFVSNYIDEAHSPAIFQWDTIFMLMFMKYVHHIFPGVESLDNFYSRQHDNGYICREIFEKSGKDYIYGGRKNTINPPVFAWAEMEYFQYSGDKARLNKVLPVLEKYMEWIESNRRDIQTKHNLFWQTQLGSGMVNSPRSGSGWVDMSAQVVLAYKKMAEMYSELGQMHDVKRCNNRVSEIASLINQWMWNKRDGFYYDINNNGEHNFTQTVAAFWPLIACVADSLQAGQLVGHLMDENSFWRKVPFPSLSARNRNYDGSGANWSGGVWAPTNYMIIQGLERYGYGSMATLAAKKYVNAIYEVFKKTGTIWELYAPDHYSEGTRSFGEFYGKKDFVGWSGLGPVSILIENILGFKCYASQDKILWTIKQEVEHGIKNLRMASITTTLICKDRTRDKKNAHIQVISNKPYILVIRVGNLEKTCGIRKGTQDLELNLP